MKNYFLYVIISVLLIIIMIELCCFISDYYKNQNNSITEEFGGGGGVIQQLQARDPQDLYEMSGLDLYNLYPYITRYPSPYMYFNPSMYTPFIMNTYRFTNNPYVSL